MARYRVVELYAGIARTWEAFRSWRRADLSLLVDHDEYARLTYVINHVSAPYCVLDLKRTSPSRIEALAGGKIDILLGCPPCQGFSDTGTRNPDDIRNAHIAVFSRFISELKPRVFVMENVPLLATSNRFASLTRKLESLGYLWDAAILNGALYGSCQTRQRLMMVGARRSIGQPRLPLPTHGGSRKYFSYSRQEFLTLREGDADILGEAPATGQASFAVPYLRTPPGRRPIPNIWETIGDLQGCSKEEAYKLSHVPWKHTGAMTRRMSGVKEGKRWRGGRNHYSQSYGRLHRQGLSRTLTCSFPNPGSGRFWHPTEDRSITLREAARIQGIEDEFYFVPPFSWAASLVGNALDIGIARAAEAAVRNLLD